MNKYVLMLAMLAVFLTPFTQISAQESGVLDGVFVRKRVAERKPVPFQYIREADAMWSKKIWRKMDMREKMNHKFYYPERKMVAEGRYSLIDLLMHSIENEGLTAYDPNADEFDEFKAELSLDEIKVRFGAEDQILEVEDENGNISKKKIAGTYSSQEVKEYLLKEEWFFDRQRSVMEVRIVGMCPIRYYYKPEDVEQENVQKKKLFWIYFPEARKVFSNHMILNPYNDAQHLTFDDVFVKRYFSSYIFQESNMFNNRQIDQYTMGVECVWESDRIKSTIMNFEIDLWEY